MVVTHRAAVIGNSGLERQCHCVVSFVGQVPVYIHGEANNGDLVIPSSELNGVCRAVSKDDCTFQEYKAAIGSVAHGGLAKAVTPKTIHQVICAITIK